MKDPLDRPWGKTGTSGTRGMHHPCYGVGFQQDGNWFICATLHKVDEKTAEVMAKAIALCIGERKLVVGVVACDHSGPGEALAPPIHEWSLPSHETNPEGK